MDYTHKNNDLLSLHTPLMFSDGSEMYKALSDEYKTHKVGYFILAPSGAGKTYFVTSQKEKNWIDGDDIWTAARAHPEGEWWLEDISIIDVIDQRCDVVTVEAKALGFRIMGASNYWLIPDAVVIPDWETHQRYVLTREAENYDGGATSKDFERLKKSREWMSRYKKENVPFFESIDEAVKFLEEKPF